MATAIEQLYANIGQTPDAGGLAYWTQQLNSGVPLAEVTKNFYTAAAGFKNTAGYQAQGTSAEALLAALTGGSTPAPAPTPSTTPTTTTPATATNTPVSAAPSLWNPVSYSGPVYDGKGWGAKTASPFSYITPWQTQENGIQLPSGEVWFPNPTNKRIGTADTSYGFASDPNQVPDAVTTKGGSTGVGQAPIDFIKTYVKQGVDYNGQQGFTVPADKVKYLDAGNGVFVQTDRNNSKYAEPKSKGGIFGTVLTFASFIPGMQWLAPYAAAYNVAEGVSTGNWGQAIGSLIGIKEVGSAIGLDKLSGLVQNTMGVSAAQANIITKAAVGGTVAGLTGGDVLRAAALSGGIAALQPSFQKALSDLGITTDEQLNDAVSKAPVEDAQPLYRVAGADGTESWVRGGPSVNGYATLENGTYLNTNTGGTATPQEIATAFPNGTQPPAPVATAPATTPVGITPPGTPPSSVTQNPNDPNDLEGTYPGNTPTGTNTPITTTTPAGGTTQVSPGTTPPGTAVPPTTTTTTPPSTSVLPGGSIIPSIVGAVAGAAGSGSTTTTSEKTPWSEAIPALKSVLALEQSNLGGHVPFNPSDLVAGLNTNQNTANASGLATANVQKQYADEVAAALKPYATGGMLDPATNPYAKAALDATLRQITEKYQQVTMPAITGNAVSANGVGGSRQAIAQALASKDYERLIADTSAKVNNDLYNQNFQQMITAQNQLPQVFTQQQQPYLIGQQVGTQQQNVDQATKNAAWQIWQASQTKQQNAANTISQIGGQGSAVTQEYPGQNPLVAAISGAVAGSQLGKVLS